MTEGTKASITSPEAIKKIHEVTKHKNLETLMWAYKCANLLDADLGRNIKKVEADCKICKKYRETFSRPKATLPKSTDINQIL